MPDMKIMKVAIAAERCQAGDGLSGAGKPGQAVTTWVAQDVVVLPGKLDSACGWALRSVRGY